MLDLFAMFIAQSYGYINGLHTCVTVYAIIHDNNSPDL